MHLLAAIAASTALFCGAIAQKLYFTDWPRAAIANNAYNIAWIGGNGSPVTIKLLAGSTINLQEVGTLTTTGANHVFNWLVPSTAPTGTNFALSIGDSNPDDLNYIGGISLSGGTGTIATSVVPVMNYSSSMPLSTASTGTGYPAIRNTTFCPGTSLPTSPPPIATAPPMMPTMTPPAQSGTSRIMLPIEVISVLIGIFVYWG